MNKAGVISSTLHRTSGMFNCLYDEHFTLLPSQNSLYDFLGYTPEEIEQSFHNRLAECIHPDDRKIVREEIARQLAEGDVFLFENRFTTKSGDTRWIWISAELIKEEVQTPYFHCTFHDISDSKKAQEDLEINEQRYEIVLSQMQDIIFELDCRTFDVYYSPNFEKKFGYSIPVKGFPDSMFDTDIIYEADKMPLRHKFQALLKGEDQMYDEYRIKRSDGIYLWVDVHATVMRDAQGGPLKIVGIISDINERKTQILETQKIARLDSLTGLLNRRECVRRINQYIEKCDELAAFILIDIDNFKALNDTLGHLYGDSVLKDLARKLSAIFRKDDVISRIGGDEFVVFLPRLTEKSDVFPKLTAIRSLFCSAEASPEASPISSSIGVCFYPEHGTDFNTLFAKADDSMYYTKKHGKNNFSLYEECRRSDDDMAHHMKPLIAMQKSFHEDIVEYLFQIFLENPDRHGSIPDILDFIGHSFFSDRIYICKKTKEGYFRPLYNWNNDGIPPMEDSLNEINTLDWNLSPELPVIAFRKTEDISTPTTHLWFEKRGVKAAFLCWLGDREKPLHLIGFEHCRKVHPEIEEMRYSLFIVSELLNMFLIQVGDNL